MRIIVAGGSGFIGRHLIAALIADGHAVTVLTRAHPERRVTSGGMLRYVHWDLSAAESGLAEMLSGADAVINLAGANIGNRRWTKRRKADLLNSRVRATEALVRTIEFLEESRRPQTLVNGSGIDFYGDRGNEVLTEGSGPGDTFLAQVCERWEHAATAAQSLGVRVVLMRTAVVLAADAVTLHVMAWPFRLFLGGPIGDGQQWFPWIHIADLVGLYTWVLGTASIAGPVNAVAPEVCMQAQVAQALGTVLSRPQRLRTPVAALRLLMGEQADLLLHGRRAIPEQALAHGYAFRFPELAPALRDCLQRDSARETTPLGLDSPFFPVLAEVVEKLPEVLRDQYLVRSEDPYRVVLEGTMDRVWHRPFWLWPFFRLFAVFDILFPEQGRDIKASMIVEGRHDGQGGGAQTWYRTFQFRRPRQFNATMMFDLRLARVVEHMAPFGMLEVIWNVSFEPPDTIRIETCGMRVGVNCLRIALPRWASVEVRVSETALLDSRETIAVSLAVRQPWLGEIFGYTGRFQVRREMKEVADHEPRPS
ncbi:MAG: TIGR01777 family oxidoreductase [Chloroflexota bacterium]|nr:TIGR01777 family oxidoreductase [Chloroflexota bacterium]